MRANYSDSAYRTFRDFFAALGASLSSSLRLLMRANYSVYHTFQDYRWHLCVIAALGDVRRLQRILYFPEFLCSSGVIFVVVTALGDVRQLQ